MSMLIRDSEGVALPAIRAKVAITFETAHGVEMTARYADTLASLGSSVESVGDAVELVLSSLGEPNKGVWDSPMM